MKTDSPIAVSRRWNSPPRAAPGRPPEDVRNLTTGNGIRPGGEIYSRLRDLPGLIALWPREVHDKNIEGARKIIAKLRHAMRAERRRGSAGHWSYDLERHLSLARALKAEVAALEGRNDAPAS